MAICSWDGPTPVIKKSTEVFGVVTVTDKNGVVVKDQVLLAGLMILEGPVGEVSFEISHTMNLGNYNSARMHVGLKIPTNITPAALDKSFEFAKAWCDEKLSAVIAEAQKELS